MIWPPQDSGTFELSGCLPCCTDIIWSQIYAGYYHMAGLKSDGSLWMWGLNYDGQFGIGATPSYSNLPFMVAAEAGWLDVACGHYYSLGVRTDGSLWSCGSSGAWLGTGTTPTTPTNVWQRIGIESDWEKVFAGWGRSFAIKTNGDLYAWGFNQYGALGLNSTTTWIYTPQLVGGGWHSVNYGERDGSGVVALKADGSLWYWGTFGSVLAPVQLASGSTFISATCGSNSYAVRSDGTLWQITGYQPPILTQIGSSSDWLAVASTRLSTASNIYDVGAAMIKIDRTVWQGITNKGLVGAVDICCGNRNAFATLDDGSVWCWGYNQYGQLGIGAGASTNTPVEMGVEA